jgi:hypothetical protein
MGVGYKTLAELSGLNPCTVWNIANFTPTIRRLNNSDLIKMQAAFDKFNETVKEIIKHSSNA